MEAPTTRQLAEWISLRLSRDEAGEPSALESEVAALFLEMRPAVLRYTASFGLPAADGEDVAQEVFLALYRHLRDRKPRTNLRGWIFRVAHNLALKRRLRDPGAAQPEEWMHCDPAPNPEEAAVSNQRQRRLLAVVRALSERDRQCLVLRAEGLAYRDIAAALDMSLGAVSISLSRSLARLASVDERGSA